MLARCRCSMLLFTFFAVVATLAASCVSLSQRMQPRDAFSDQDSLNNEGEDHSTIRPYNGAAFVSFPIPESSSSLAAYWTSSPRNSTAETAFIMIHGKLRDGANYWTIINNAVQSAISARYTNANSTNVVVAPEFFSTRLNSGQYSDQQLSWADTNTWQAGEPADHPTGNTLTSIDALDALVDEFSDSVKYPQMRQIVLVGHGGGAQLLSRYAVVGEEAPDPTARVKIRYVIGDPSSNVYFTQDRPLDDPSIAQISTCPLYNTWRYGFEKFNGTAEGGSNQTPQDYFANFVRRDVRWIVGYQDTTTDGDETCMAYLQGGVARRDRNLSWWRYLNTLAGTKEDLTGFPGSLPSLTTSWANLTNGTIDHRLTVVQYADHDAAVVFGSQEGRSALFDSSFNVLLGWRPQNWRNTSAEDPSTSSVTSITKPTNTSSDTVSVSSAGRWTLPAVPPLLTLSSLLATFLIV